MKKTQAHPPMNIACKHTVIRHPTSLSSHIVQASHGSRQLIDQELQRYRQRFFISFSVTKFKANSGKEDVHTFAGGLLLVLQKAKVAGRDLQFTEFAFGRVVYIAAYKNLEA